MKVNRSRVLLATCILFTSIVGNAGADLDIPGDGGGGTTLVTTPLIEPGPWLNAYHCVAKNPYYDDEPETNGCGGIGNNGCYWERTPKGSECKTSADSKQCRSGYRNAPKYTKSGECQIGPNNVYVCSEGGVWVQNGTALTPSCDEQLGTVLVE